MPPAIATIAASRPASTRNPEIGQRRPTVAVIRPVAATTAMPPGANEAPACPCRKTNTSAANATAAAIAVARSEGWITPRSETAALVSRVAATAIPTMHHQIKRDAAVAIPIWISAKWARAPARSPSAVH